MKAKHVLMAMSLPIAFAACTQDEIVDKSNTAAENLNRPVVGEISVSLGNEDSATRLVDPESGAQDWSTGSLGAALMDEMTDASASGLAKYTLSNNVYTDYPFTRVAGEEGAAWETTGILLEGNYFFYYGNKDRLALDRSGFVYTIATEQNALNNEDGSNKYQAVADNQLYISYQGLRSNTNYDGKKINLSLAPAHKQLNFSVKYEGESEIKIYKVELEAVGGNFMVKGALNPANFSYIGTYPTWAYDATNETMKEIESEELNYTLPDLFNWYNNDKIYAKYGTKATHNPLNLGTSFTLVEKSSKIAVNLSSVKISDATNKTVSFAMIVPNNNANSYNVNIYTDKGIVTYTAVGTQNYKESGNTLVALDQTESTGDYDAEGAVKEGVTVVASAKLYDGVTGEGDTDPYAALGTTLEELVPQDPQGLVLTFTNKAIKVSPNFDVASTDDLELFLGYHDFQSYSNETATPITATLTTNNVQLSDNAYKLLTNNAGKFALTVAGDGTTLTLATTEATDAFHKLTWGNGVKAKVAANSTQIISSAVNESLVITNEGTLTINNMTGKDKNNNPIAVNTTLGNIFNKGTLTVATSVTSSTVYNGSVVDKPNYLGITTAATASINADIAKLNNYAEATVTVNETIENKSVSNKATHPSYRKGNLTLAGAGKTFNVTNAGEMTVSENAKVVLNNTGTATFDADVNLSGSNDGTITNNKAALIDAEFTNSGTFTNNNTLTVNDGQEFANNGTLKVTADAEMTLITTNEGGTIEIAERDPLLTVGNKDEASQGTIVYTAVEADIENGMFVSKDLDAFNKLVIGKAADFTNLMMNGNNESALSVAATTVKSIELKVTENSNFKFANGTSVENLIVGDGVNSARYTLLAPNFTISNSLTVKVKATLYIHDTSVVNFTATSGITNSGTVTTAGKFVATSCTKPDGTFTGSGANYTWASAADSLVAAIAAGEKNVTLPGNVTLSGALEISQNCTIDLNGKTITNKLDNASTDVMIVNGGTTTISGNGVVEAVSGNDGYGVIVNDGAILVIEGGHFKAGNDNEGVGNCCVYAKGSAKVLIKGGKFEMTGSPSASMNKQYTILNIKSGNLESTNFEVTGGEFKNFNPGNNYSEGAGTDFVPEGFKVVDSATGEEITEAHNTAGSDIWYKVVPVED